MWFYLIANWLILALCIMAVALVAKSRISTLGKLSFGGFIFFGMLLPRIRWFLFPWRRGLAGNGLLRLIYNLAPVFEVMAVLMLLAFALAVAETFSATASTDGKTNPWYPTPKRLLGHVWATKLTPMAKHQVLRRREWAYLIDLAPILLYLVVTGIVSGVTNSRGVHEVLSLLGACAAGWWFFYVPIKDARAGQSIGKYVSESRVVDLATGTPIGIKQSLVRNVPLVIPGFAVVEFLVAMIRQDRRRLGDLLAGSIVVKGKPQFIDGVEVPAEAVVVKEPTKHPLD